MGSQKKKKKRMSKRRAHTSTAFPHPRASLEVDVSAAGAEALEDIGSNS